MKKNYILLLSALTLVSANAQTQNWDLETWTASGTYDTPDGWNNINQYAAALGINPIIEKVTTGAPQGFLQQK